MRASRSLSIAAIAVVVLLSGCAHRVGVLDTAGSSADSGPATSAPTHYNGPWDGRMSLKLAAFGQEAAKGVQVTFNLDGTPARGTLDLSTPLGTRMASVQGL